MMIRAAIAAMIMIATACGRDSVTGPGPSNPHNETIAGTVAVFGTTRHQLPIPRSGQLTLRLTWETPAVDLDLYLAASACTTLYPIESCGVLAASDAATGTVEQVTRPVSSGEIYSVFVDNLSLAQGQAYTLAVMIE